MKVGIQKIKRPFREKYFLLVGVSFLVGFLQPLSALEPEVRRALPASSVTEVSPQESQGDIRIAPATSSDPAQIADNQLAVAEGFFNRKQYDMAISEYQKFLNLTSPGEAHRDQALFHLGEIFREQQNGFKAEETYLQLLKEKPSGDFAAAAAYRLGEYYSVRKESKKAAESFAQAVTLSTNPAIQNAARYQQALCRDQLGEDEKATSLLNEVSKTEENNPTRMHAMMLLAEREEKEGEKEKALADYQTIIHETTGEMLAEALVKAGMVSSDLGKKEQALQFFEIASATKDGGEWSAIAALGSMKIFYADKEYQKVLSKSEQASSSSNLQGRSEALLMVANTQRLLNHQQEALSLYNKITQEFPGTDPANEAAFNRLLVLQVLHDPKIISQIEGYLLATTDIHRKAQANLLKAEVLFEASNYAEAAQAYSLISSSDLSAELKEDALYKEAWSLKEIGDKKGAIALLSQLITIYPKTSHAGAALIQRASLKQKTGDLVGAIADYSILINRDLHSPERELALQQKALCEGEQRDNKAMSETFQQLLKDYPKSAAASQANFWIGWAAFENKDYVGAVPFLEKARDLNSKQFGERAGVRLLLCHYYHEEFPETLRETERLHLTAVPIEVLRWLGLKAYEKGDMAQAEHFLSVVANSGRNNLITLDVESSLAKALIAQGKFQEAEIPTQKMLSLSTDPTTRAEAMLTLTRLQKGRKKYEEADKSVNEALLLQPEGKLNIEARLLQADLLALRGNDDAAARAYMAIGLLTDDPITTPQALRKAAEAYRNANNPEEAKKAMKELEKRFPVKS